MNSFRCKFVKILIFDFWISCLWEFTSIVILLLPFSTCRAKRTREETSESRKEGGDQRSWRHGNTKTAKLCESFGSSSRRGHDSGLADGAICSCSPEYVATSRASSVSSDEDPASVPVHQERTFLVFESNKLLASAGCGELSCSFTKRLSGTALNVTFICKSCPTTHSWTSHTGNTPAGNILSSTAVVCATIGNVVRVFEHLSEPWISARRFHRHGRDFILAGVESVWEDQQRWLIAAPQAEQRGRVSGGDGRAPDILLSLALTQQWNYVVLDINVVQVNDISCLYI